MAQTRIQFNGKQLLQLIHQHLLSNNLTEVAALLQRDAGLPPPPPPKPNGTAFPPYRNSTAMTTPSTPSRPSRLTGQVPALQVWIYPVVFHPSSCFI